MRCLKCRKDGVPLSAEVCPGCGVYLPSLIRDLLPHGTLLDGGKYRVDYALGQGGFGITYRGFDLNLERPVAIKEFYPQDYVHREGTTGRLSVTTSDSDAYQKWLQRFEREGRILARLTHSSIVKVYALFKERDTAYLVMELLQGGTLGDELKTQPGNRLSEARVVEIMTALVDALDTVHQEGVYHLDLKPDNIMLTHDRRIVLVDFEAARQDMSRSSSSFSKKSTTAYTIDYAPPEMIGGQSVSAASDLFELGMMLHEMLTGCLPSSAWNRLLKDTWKPTALEWPWRKMVEEALQLRLEERPETVKEWWQTYTNWVLDQDLHKKLVEVEAQVDQLVSREKRIIEEKRINSSTLMRNLSTVLEDIDRNQTVFIVTLDDENEFVLGPLSICSRILGLYDPEYGWPVTVNAEEVDDVIALAPGLRRHPFICGWGYWAVGIQTGEYEDIKKAQNQPKRDKQQLSLQTFKFEVVTVNQRGQIIQRQQKQAPFFALDLGNGVILEMVAIPAGEFMMGSPADELGRSDKEGPQHRVSVSAFYMGRFQVTQAQWEAVVGTDLTWPGENHPVNIACWYDAQNFCKRLSQKTGRKYRLPSEAEWEYACRAGTTTPFYFGPTITTDLANYRGTDEQIGGETFPGNYGSGPKGQDRRGPIEVGSFPPNAFGLYDMHGNVWEWCEDVYHDSYKGAPTDGSAWVSGGDSSGRLLRGGCWGSSPRDCRSARRMTFPEYCEAINTGFRVVYSPPELS